MAALFLPLFAFLALLLPINDSIILMNRQVRELAELDKKLGDDAETTANFINSALALNAGLIALVVACPVAMATRTDSLVTAAGNLIRFQQETFLYAAQGHMAFISPISFEKEFNKPKRNSSTICELPGTLYCPDKTLFYIKNRDGSKPAGVKGESESCTTVRWKYSDDRVRPL